MDVWASRPGESDGSAGYPAVDVVHELVEADDPLPAVTSEYVPPGKPVSPCPGLDVPRDEKVPPGMLADELEPGLTAGEPPLRTPVTELTLGIPPPALV